MRTGVRAGRIWIASLGRHGTRILRVGSSGVLVVSRWSGPEDGRDQERVGRPGRGRLLLPRRAARVGWGEERTPTLRGRRGMGFLRRPNLPRFSEIAVIDGYDSGAPMGGRRPL
jgi:hypothetical protein